jgi:effector-binding domain-containing protein
MDYACEAVERPSQPVLSIRTRVHVQNLPEVLGKGYADIAQYLESLGEAPSGDPFVAYYNMDMENLDMEMGFPVSGKVPGQGEIQASEIPAGKYATCLHIGPYPDLGMAYEALTEWIKGEGYEVTGVAYEFYLNDATVTPPPELKTLLLFPIVS